MQTSDCLIMLEASSIIYILLYDNKEDRSAEVQYKMCIPTAHYALVMVHSTFILSSTNYTTISEPA